MGEQTDVVPPGAVHGRASTYNAGCRCRPCRDANAERQADYQHRRRQSGGSTVPHRVPVEVACRWCDWGGSASAFVTHRRAWHPDLSFVAEGGAITLEVVSGQNGGPPYLWIGDGQQRFLDSLSPEQLAPLRAALTAVLRDWR